jgi:hypothetical protein
MRFLQAMVISGCSLVPAYAAAQDIWMTVMLDGQKVGNMHVVREQSGGEVITSQSLDVRFSRLAMPMVVHARLGATESLTGAPLGFSSKGGQASALAEISAERRDDGTFQLANVVQGQSSVTVLQWPEGALLPEGQRLETVAHGFTRGTSYRLRQFESSRQQVADIDVTVIGDEWVDLPGGREQLHHLRQVLAGGDSAQTTETWVDDDGMVRRSIAPLQAFRVEMAACDEACANAPDQDVDLLRAAMVSSPRPLPASLRTGAMRFVVAVRGSHPNPFMDTDEQLVTPLGDGLYQIDTSYAQPYDDEDRPTREDTAANPWVQSDAPDVRALASKVVGDADKNILKMRRLRAFLTDYIDGKDLDIGYASALETLHSRRGDCTEHAVLLAALARSLHIPARVVTGLVYVDHYGGAQHVFIPHAWVQAWVEGHWVSYDSAQGRYDTTHIALAAGDGDPWRFFAAHTALGSMDIQQATPVAATIDPKTRGLARPELSRGTFSSLQSTGGGLGH